MESYNGSEYGEEYHSYREERGLEQNHHDQEHYQNSYEHGQNQQQASSSQRASVVPSSKRMAHDPSATISIRNSTTSPPIHAPTDTKDQTGPLARTSQQQPPSQQQASRNSQAQPTQANHSGGGGSGGRHDFTMQIIDFLDQYVQMCQAKSTFSMYSDDSS
jgi:hypothetical protein